MYTHVNGDPALMQYAVDQSDANLKEQIGNQARMLANHEGTRGGFFGMAGRSYEGAFVNQDGTMSATGQDHGRINEADQYTVTEYRVTDESLVSGFNAAVNP